MIKVPFFSTKVFMFGISLLLAAHTARAQQAFVSVSEDFVSVSAAEALQNLPHELREEIEQELRDDGISDHQLRNIFLSAAPGNEIQVSDETETVDANHLVYLGGRIGVPYLYGLVATYLNQKEGRPRFHLDVDGSVTLLIVGTSASAGFHPFGNGFYIGGRAHYMAVADFVDEADKAKNDVTAAGLEMGLVHRFGKKQRGLFSARVGYFDGPDLRPYPDVAIGVSIRLLKR